MRAFTISFPAGTTAVAIRVAREVELADALREVGLAEPISTLVLLGGAGGLTEADLSTQASLFADQIAPACQRAGAAVVDGGTDAGVMRLMGAGRANVRGTFPLIGVAAIGTVDLPHDPAPLPDSAGLDPNHSHFILVPGTGWGDESPWLGRVAQVLAGGKPSATVLINGGEIAWDDVWMSVRSRRRVIVVAGTGRLADSLAAALRGEPPDERAHELAKTGQLLAVDHGDPDILRQVIEDVMTGRR